MESNLKRLPGPLASRSRIEQKASILIITLWSLFLLTAFTVILGYGVRQKITLLKRLEERARLRYLGDSNLKIAIGRIMNWDPGWVLRLRPGGYLDEQPGQTDSVLGTASSRFVIIDEERKINIDTAELPVLKRLFQDILNCDVMQAQEMAASIIDWRDSDDMLSLPLGSAESSYYQDLRYSYAAKNADYEVLNELLLVKGVTPEVFAKVKDYITIYGDGKVNINTAPRQVLLALGIHDIVADMILIFRQGADRKVGTADDNYFDNISTVSAKLLEMFRMGPDQVDYINTVAQLYLTVNSNHFTIKSMVKLLRNQDKVVEASCVVDRKGKILYWQEF
jgi:general secretion pathway protein K